MLAKLSMSIKYLCYITYQRYSFLVCYFLNSQHYPLQYTYALQYPLNVETARLCLLSSYWRQNRSGRLMTIDTQQTQRHPQQYNGA